MNTLRIAFILLLALGARSSTAQTVQHGQLFTSSGINTNITQFRITSPTVPVCGNTPIGYVKPTSWGMDIVDPLYSTPEYFSLPAGNGAQSFDVSFTAQYANPMTPIAYFAVYVDGQYCPSCTAVPIINSPALGTNPVQLAFRITHFGGNAWSNNGVREFMLRGIFNSTTDPLLDILFRAVMVGTAYTDVIGHYNAPSMPLYILRDPPGGASFSSLTSGSTTCFGQSHSVNAGNEQNTWYKAKVGVAGEAGLFVTTEFELYVEAGVNMTASQSETSTYEYQTCLETTTEFTTANNGTPDDLFIGSEVRYAYGMAQTVERPGCGTVEKYAHFASTPVEVLSSYHYNESYILGTVIPELEQEIAAMPVGSAAYERAVNQLSVWQQALEVNASIKANAPLEIMRSFNGGNAGFTHSQTTTTNTRTAIEYKAILEQGLTAELAVEAGGTGISGGGAIKMRTEYGNGEQNSNASTNTLSYHLEDPDVFDDLTVEVRRDHYFGSHVFVLDSTESRTSCRYEGGYALDQPALYVGTSGNTSMTVNEVPVGTATNFPLIICNNSDTTRTYYLRFSAVTNTQGAVLQAFGNTLNSNDNGIPLILLGGQCINTNLALTQPNAGVLDFPNINLYLYSLCDEEYPPYVRSYITVSAHYGPGNFGAICEPVSAAGTSEGDFIDGVQIGAINNTGTGAVGGAAYTNYGGQFSTPLSRGAQRLLTITSGAYFSNSFAAWIDYDHDGVFAADEQLGAFQSTAAYQPGHILFTVPADADLGSAVLRVRSTYYPALDPATMDACFNYDYGETEDYSVVIDANTPQDCLGLANGTALPGTPCNDGDAATGNDTWNANCACIGIALDCAGTPGGTAVVGTTCDDGDATTGGDVYDADCQCAGTLIDCAGVVGGTSLPGAPCNDGDPTTGNDSYSADCTCAGLVIDCAGTPGGALLPGAPCDDGNPLSADDVITAGCLCAGSIAVDCNGIENGTAQPGTPCNDDDPATGDDRFGVDCVCAGQPYDCAGTPGGTLLPGTPCDDANPNSANDMFNANCACVGELVADCAGVPGGTAQPGTPCDDDNSDTGNDAYNAFCECIGEAIDCEGVVGGSALPGAFCNDGDPTTGGDAYSFNCECTGQPYDCEGNPGGMSTPGVPCDDGDPDTDNDVWSAQCICAGTLPMDCAGVPGGDAQPGTPCDDGDADTGNDVYTTDCTCAGQLIDCLGAAGGSALPGAPCNDGDACTTNDVLGADCGCSGTIGTVGSISGPSEVDAGDVITFFITPIAGASAYSWDLPAGWSSDNTGTFVLVADAGSVVGVTSVCVNVTVNGCVIDACTSVMVVDANSVEEGVAAEWFSVAPNPSNGTFQLIPRATTGTFTLVVYDATGREVLNEGTNMGAAPVLLDLSAMESGAYYLMATRGREQRVMQLQVVR